MSSGFLNLLSAPYELWIPHFGGGGSYQPFYTKEALIKKAIEVRFRSEAEETIRRQYLDSPDGLTIMFYGGTEEYWLANPDLAVKKLGQGIVGEGKSQRSILKINDTFGLPSNQAYAIVKNRILNETKSTIEEMGNISAPFEILRVAFKEAGDPEEIFKMNNLDFEFYVNPGTSWPELHAGETSSTFSDVALIPHSYLGAFDNDYWKFYGKKGYKDITLGINEYLWLTMHKEEYKDRLKDAMNVVFQRRACFVEMFGNLTHGRLGRRFGDFDQPVMNIANALEREGDYDHLRGGETVLREVLKTLYDKYFPLVREEYMKQFTRALIPTWNKLWSLESYMLKVNDSTLLEDSVKKKAERLFRSCRSGIFKDLDELKEEYRLPDNNVTMLFYWQIVRESYEHDIIEGFTDNLLYHDELFPDAVDNLMMLNLDPVMDTNDIDDYSVWGTWLTILQQLEYKRKVWSNVTPNYTPNPPMDFPDFEPWEKLENIDVVPQDFREYIPSEDSGIETDQALNHASHKIIVDNEYIHYMDENILHDMFCKVLSESSKRIIQTTRG